LLGSKDIAYWLFKKNMGTNQARIGLNPLDWDKQWVLGLRNKFKLLGSKDIAYWLFLKKYGHKSGQNRVNHLDWANQWGLGLRNKIELPVSKDIAYICSKRYLKNQARIGLNHLDFAS
jgi:hypothetical protein